MLLQATNNLEWYDPEAVSTQNGSLVIKFSELFNHGLDYQGGKQSPSILLNFLTRVTQVSYQLGT